MSTSTITKQKSIGICQTHGDGLWSHTAKPVSIVELDLAYLNGDSLLDSTFGELRAYFDEATWDTDTDGLIYTDKNWMSEFKKLLVKKGFSQRAVEAIEYSEQGMQGDKYVSMDIGDPFIVECDKFINFTEGKSPKKVDITISASFN